MSDYFRNVKAAFGTLSEGLKLTFGYLADARKSRKPIGIEDEHYFDTDRGIVTLQYPYESLPVPDNARYRLHNEIDDCIVCDKCAKVCPVDCIDIEAIRAPETFGMTSDGTAKRIHAARFDIDMAKCCFCGLCTTVCPTECLTMTKVYDFSEFEVKDHVYSFSKMTLAEIAQKRKELEAFEAKKAMAKVTAGSGEDSSVASVPKPAIRPKPVASKPAMKPKTGDQGSVVKPTIPGNAEGGTATGKPAAESSRPRPVVKKPLMKPKEQTSSVKEEQTEDQQARPRPVMKPKLSTPEEQVNAGANPHPAKPVIKRPVIPLKTETKPAEEGKSESPEEKPKYRPRPVMRKKPKDGDENQ